MIVTNVDERVKVIAPNPPPPSQSPDDAVHWVIAHINHVKAWGFVL